MRRLFVSLLVLFSLQTAYSYSVQYHDNKAVVFLSYGLGALVGASRFSSGILHRTLLREAS